MVAQIVASDAAPIADINTTPLIDVMLVLLIMFVITIPVATNSVDIDLPSTTSKPAPVHLDPLRNRLVLTAGDRLTWNGQPIARTQLPGILAETSAMPREPELQFHPAAGASYGAAASILATIKAARISRFGFVGNEAYRDFGR